MLFAGTGDGVYRISNTDSTDDYEHVLETDRVMRVRAFDAVSGVFAATKSGLYHSLDGSEWVDLGVPRKEVYSVCVSPSGERLYAGTHPAHMYVSTSFDLGSSDRSCEWRELTGFQEVPSRGEWHTPRHRNEAHVRSLGTHPDAPERVIAGVEVGGVHVSDDEGETWSERRIEAFDTSYSNDVHHVLIVERDRYIASNGGGLYRTTDAGRSWTRIDDDIDHSYFREAFIADGRLYAAAARDPPGTWGGELGPDAALFESTDGGNTFDAVSYPGGPEEFVLAWTVDDAVFAGTRGGWVLRRTDGEWTDVGRLPSSIRSLMSL